MQSLSRLKSLNLSCCQFQTLPVSMAAALHHLQYLDLSSNDFQQVPAAIGKITTLQTLDMSGNHELELNIDDLDTLAALSCLTSLCVCKNPDKPDLHAGFSQASLSVLHDVSQRFPELHLPKELHTIR